MTNVWSFPFPILAAFDIGEWIGPAFVAIFFFILPILRAMKEAKEKQRQMAERQGGTGTQAESAREAAKRKWEELLRGEEGEAGPYAPPTMAGAETEHAPPPSLRPSVPHQPAEPVPQPLFEGSLSPFEPVASEEQVERSYDEGRSLEQGRSLEDGRFDEEKSAHDAHEEALRAERRRRAEFLAAERGDALARADVASALAPSMGAGMAPQRMSELSIAPPAAAAPARETTVGAGAGFGSRSALRRAILASEILGKPVGLRDGSEATGPLGARR
jgi:hypothetical protein